MEVTMKKYFQFVIKDEKIFIVICIRYAHSKNRQLLHSSMTKNLLNWFNQISYDIILQLTLYKHNRYHIKLN